MKKSGIVFSFFEKHNKKIQPKRRIDPITKLFYEFFKLFTEKNYLKNYPHINFMTTKSIS